MTCRSDLDQEKDKEKQKELQNKIQGKVSAHLTCVHSRNRLVNAVEKLTMCVFWVFFADDHAGVQHASGR